MINRQISARTLTKIIVFIDMIDDVYDVYGTLDELELFTDAILRWDVNAVENFPHYLKLCFLVTYNGINEVAYDALKEHGIDTIQYLKKVWGDLCKAYLQEAKWYFSGYKPTLKEYINNGWVSITTPIVLLHAYIGTANPINREELEGIANYHKILQIGGTLFRYADDLGTSSVMRFSAGDVPKAIQCYDT
ncbi:hypothetical protein Leryth_027288 [Lithospermum erythrorhizon]|nr:hypothetical protein Leryth_027288 [Lithospermum erythrorhizon]